MRVKGRVVASHDKMLMPRGSSIHTTTSSSRDMRRQGHLPSRHGSEDMGSLPVPLVQVAHATITTSIIIIIGHATASMHALPLRHGGGAQAWRAAGVWVVLVVEGRWIDGSGIVGGVGVGAVGRGRSRGVVEAHDKGEAGTQ